jgi:hypothetical protein
MDWLDIAAWGAGICFGVFGIFCVLILAIWWGFWENPH